MNFSTAQYVTDTLRSGDEVERVRSANRTLVNNMLNGFPFLDEASAKKWKLDINCNFGEAPVLAAHARRQYDNAMLGSQNYFKVTLPKAPEDKKTGWGAFITQEINRPMKKSEEYTSLFEYQFASVVAHGIGPQMWRDAENWLPDYVAVEDFRVPTDTKTSFKDLAWFAERHLYTPGELSQKVFGLNADKRWKKTAIAKILHEYDDINYLPNSNANWVTMPERRAELWKQNLGYFSSDAVPSISMWHFFYYDDTDPKDCFWKLCVVPDWGEGTPRGCQEPEFLFDSGAKPFARNLEHIINVQFGDLNTKAPFMYHSVRSMGFLLMEPCFWNNLALCRQLQYLMESFNPWFRVDDPNDRARVQKIDLAGQSVLEKGVSIVPNTERHQVAPQLIESVMAKLKQLQSEASQSYTQSTDTGTAREQTAFETRVKLSAVNAMMTGLLGRAFRKRTHSDREICRRFCLRRTSNVDARQFQAACVREGIPRVWLNSELWEIEPEMPMGSGNPTMAMTAIQELMGLYPYLNPTAQAEVIHEAVEVYTNDPRKADRWAPIGKEAALSEGKQLAGAVFGSLMTGVPVAVKESVPASDLIETWLGMMAGVIHRIEQTDNIGTMEEIIGLQNVGQAITQQIQKLAQIQSAKSKVKEYGDALGQLMNLVKGFGQRLAEKNAQQNGDQETQAKVQAIQQTTQAKLQSKQMTDAQKLQQKQIAFESDQQRKNMQTASDLKRKQVQTDSDIDNETALVGTDIAHQTAMTAADIANQRARSAANPSSGEGE
jgi:hypothetical protein